MNKLLAIVLTAGSAQAAVFTSDFESPSLSAGGSQIFTVGQSVDGWTVETGSVSILAAGGSNHAAATGSQFLNSFAGGGSSTTIYRDIAVQPGQTYTVSYSFYSEPNKEVILQWNNSTIGVAGGTLNTGPWASGTANFSVFGSSGRLSITSAFASPGVGLDNISVDLASVPEPEEWAMVAGIGLIGFGIWHRRQKVVHTPLMPR